MLEEELHELAGRGNGGGKGALLLLDLDDFKLVNETFGYSVGDRILVAVARLLGGAVGGGRFLARLEGDEFAVLVGGLLRRRLPGHLVRGVLTGSGRM